MSWRNLKAAMEWVLPAVLLVLWFMPTDWIIGMLFPTDEDPIVQLGISQPKKN